MNNDTNNLIIIKSIEDNKIDTRYSKSKDQHTIRLEIKNWLSGGKFIFAFQELDANNKQIAFTQCYMSVAETLGFVANVLDGTFIKQALASDPKGENITEVFKSMGGSDKEGKITYRDLTLSKGKKWILKAQECPGKKTTTGGFAPDGKATVMISMGLNPIDLKSIAKFLDHEYVAYRTAQMFKTISER